MGMCDIHVSTTTPSRSSHCKIVNIPNAYHAQDKMKRTPSPDSSYDALQMHYPQAKRRKESTSSSDEQLSGNGAGPKNDPHSLQGSSDHSKSSRSSSNASSTNGAAAANHIANHGANGQEFPVGPHPPYWGMHHPQPPMGYPHGPPPPYNTMVMMPYPVAAPPYFTAAGMMAPSWPQGPPSQGPPGMHPYPGWGVPPYYPAAAAAASGSPQYPPASAAPPPQPQLPYNRMMQQPQVPDFTQLRTEPLQRQNSSHSQHSSMEPTPLAVEVNRTRSPIMWPHGIPLALPTDEEHLSEYHCLVRAQIDLFAATQVDLQSSMQGRNRPIVLSQVGLRCRHCSHMNPPNRRPPGAVYYPSKLTGLYQAAINMAKNHLIATCIHIPTDIKARISQLKDKKTYMLGGGKGYWSTGGRIRHVVERDERLFFFQEGDDDDNNEDQKSSGPTTKGSESHA